MRLLLDTHALLWWLADDDSLTPHARRLIEQSSNRILVSAASAWEIGTKVRLGKLPTAEELVADFVGYLARDAFADLGISAEHGIRAELLIGQCHAENLPLTSSDTIFDSYKVRRMW